MRFPLSPAQSECLTEARSYCKPGRVITISGENGTGKSTVLQALADETRGEYISMSQFMEWQRDADPLRLEETVEWLLSHSLAQYDIVLFDDLHRLMQVFTDPIYPRKNYIHAALAEIPNYIQENNRTLICIASKNIPQSFEGSLSAVLPAYTAKDYETIITNYLHENAANLDFKKLFSQKSDLNARRLRALSDHLEIEGLYTTEAMLNFAKLYI